MAYGFNTSNVYYDVSQVPGRLRGLVALGFKRLASYNYFQIREAQTVAMQTLGISVAFADDLRTWWKWAPSSYSAISFSTQWGHDEDIIVVRNRESFDDAKLVHLIMHELSHILLNHPSHVMRPTSVLWPITTQRQTLDSGDRQMFHARFGRGML